MTHTYPNWSAPESIFGFTTQRHNGTSKPPYTSNNLGYHVGDDPKAVQANRLMLLHNLPAEPNWMEQTHSTNCIVIEDTMKREADAAITRKPNHVLAIMTADCLPILLCNKQGTEVAAIHAGWRGLVSGIIENTIAQMKSSPNEILAWIGPAICKDCFEVGSDVYELYKKNYPFSDVFFKYKQPKWLADLVGIASRVLQENGVMSVSQSNKCTFENKKEFYSYRREAQTGRMATLIWFTK